MVEQLTNGNQAPDVLPTQRQTDSTNGQNDNSNAASGLAGAIADAWQLNRIGGRQAGADQGVVNPEKQINQNGADHGAVNEVAKEMKQLRRPGTVGDQLDQELNNAINEATRRVLQDPRWDRSFTNAINRADNDLAQHPKLGMEIKLASIDATIAQAKADALKGAVSKLIAGLPKEEQQKLHNLAMIKDGGASYNAYLKEKHPDIYAVQLKAKDAANEFYKAQEHLDKLKKIQTDVVQTRLEYAEFLARRGMQGDDRKMTALLLQVIGMDPSAVSLKKPGENFDRVRSLAFQAGGLQNADIVKALKDAGVDPKDYFFAKFQRGWKQLLPQQGIPVPNVIEGNDNNKRAG